MKVEELMTREVVTVGPEETLREVASLLATEHIGGVPVVAGEEVVGVISAADVLDFDADAPGSPAERVEQTSGFGEAAGSLAAEVGRVPHGLAPTASRGAFLLFVAGLLAVPFPPGSTRTGRWPTPVSPPVQRSAAPPDRGG